MAEPDPIRVRRGSRTLHRMAWLIFGFGLLTHGLIVSVMFVLNALPGQRLVRAPALSLPTDTALGLLGVSATVLIALVATLWATGQVSDAGLSRGRRRALTAVTTATGVGSVAVGAAGASHRPDDGWSLLIALALLCLGVALAYVAADVAFFMIEDRPLDEALRHQDADERRARLRTARRNWLRLSRAAKWTRGRRPGWDRLRQTVVLFGLFSGLLAGVLVTLGGRRAVTGYLGWLCLDVAVGLATGQLVTHYVAVKWVARRWEPLYWYGIYAFLYVPASLLAQSQILIWMLDDLPATTLADTLVVLACWLVPPLMCLAGLTVVPRRWNRLRPMTQIRWSVIAAIGHEIDRVGKSLDSETPQRKRPSVTARLRRAARRATGAEEMGPGDD